MKNCSSADKVDSIDRKELVFKQMALKLSIGCTLVCQYPSMLESNFLGMFVQPISAFTCPLARVIYLGIRLLYSTSDMQAIIVFDKC